MAMNHVAQSTPVMHEEIPASVLVQYRAIFTVGYKAHVLPPD